MDARDLEQMVDEYGPQVYRFCLKLSRRKPDAEDLYQQTFLKILEQSMEIRRDWNPQSFLFSIAYGIWRNEQRKHLRHSAEPSELLLSEAAADNTEEEALVRLEAAEIRKAVEQLPAKYRIPLILQYTFEMPLEEIGKIEKIPLGTVKSRLHQAKALIKKEMEANGYGKANWK